MSRIAARTAARTATRIVTRIVTGLFALALLAAPATPAAAQSFQQGLAAAERGDYAAALREWRPLAEAGDAYAQASLAALHVRGHGVPVDIAEALKWFRLAAAQGLSAAQFNLGQLLSNPNTGSLRDVGEAMIWYGRAAEQGNAAAHYKLGLLHANGGPGPQDLARTFMHWTIADTLGFAEAARQLDGLRALISAAQTADGKRQAADWMAAYKVRSGETARLRDAQAESESEIDRLRGTLAARTAEAAALRQQIVEMDSAVAGLRAEIAARKTARKAALAAPPGAAPDAGGRPEAAGAAAGESGGESGDPPPTIASGIAAYAAGDYASAFAIWLPLAKAGSARAQFHVGALYHEGRGIARDAAEARHWLGVAAHNGSASARTLLQSLD